MRIFDSVDEAQRNAAESTKRRVLVPTMGALHHGHVKLMQIARDAAGRDGEVVVSIFVNPLQFEPGADYERYPRPQTEDEEVCRRAGVDLLLRPTPAEMYRQDRSVFVEETSLSNRLCGASRPGHFRGVCTVVTKLFHLLEPDAAVFGEKDFQQLAIIRRVVRDLNFPIEIIAAPTVREPDGLAASSRNRYLSAEERKHAPIIRAALLEVARQVKDGNTSTARLLEHARSRISSVPGTRIDYIEFVNADNLQPAERAGKDSVIAAAVFFGQTRLIDNLRLG